VPVVTWRVVVSSEPPDQYGRIDPGSILLLLSSSGDTVAHALKYAEGAIASAADKARYVGVYPQ
jgi:hypothetical protein